MIRDSSKLICRIIEEFENAGKRARGDTEFQPNRQGLAIPVEIPGLTDRNEWPDATLKAFYYGAELNKGFIRKSFTSDDKVVSSSQRNYEASDVSAPASTMMYTVRGEGSPVEEFIKTMQADGKKIPQRILLTGKSR